MSFFSCGLHFIVTEHADRTANCTLLFLFWICLIWTFTKFFILPKMIFFPLQMENFVLGMNLYWLQTGRFFSLSLCTCETGFMWVFLKETWKITSSVAEGEITDHQECATFHDFPLNFQLISLVPIVYLFLCSSLKCTLLGKRLLWHFTNISGFHHPSSALLDVYWTSNELLDTAAMPNLDCVVKAALNNSEQCWLLVLATNK